MNRFALKIMLWEEDTRTFGIIGIVFQNYCIPNTYHYFPYKNIVLNQLIIPMS